MCRVRRSSGIAGRAMDRIDTVARGEHRGSGKYGNDERSDSGNDRLHMPRDRERSSRCSVQSNSHCYYPRHEGIEYFESCKISGHASVVQFPGIHQRKFRDRGI